ncbi:MAG: hypothetical protein EOP56_07390 [Sphingobacteriales bacterium]|nr:MAG: hypothetical protein EOP56_07390 [Sphingobacteriales bacterium]
MNWVFICSFTFRAASFGAALLFGGMAPFAIYFRVWPAILYFRSNSRKIHLSLKKLNRPKGWPLLVCFLLLHICLQSYGRSASYNITYRLLSRENGLANRVASSGLQDSRGFIWVGTRDGLNRYDGYSFELLTREKNGLQSNNVADLCEDQDKKLWILYGVSNTNILSGGKIDILDLYTHKVVPFETYFGKSALFSPKQVIAISNNAQRDLFIHTSDSFVYAYNGKTFTKLNAREQVDEKVPEYFFVNTATSKGLWIRYDYFVSKDSRHKKVPEHRDGYRPMYFKGEDSLIVMYLNKGKVTEYGQQQTYSVSPGGIYPYTPPFDEAEKKLFFDICKKDYYFLIGDDPTGYTLIQKDGTDLYLMRNEQMIHLLNIADLKGIAALQITDVFSDNGGKIWACTNAGLLIFDVAENRFTHYLNSREYKLDGNYTNYQVRGISTDRQGNIYASTITGAYKITDHDTDDIALKTLTRESYNTPMVRDGDKFYYGQTQLYEYNSTTDEIRHVLGKDTHYVWSIHKLGEDKWWVSEHDCVYLVKGKQYHNIYNEDGRRIEHGFWIHQFFTDNEGNKWMAGAQGLYRMKNDSVVAEHWSATTMNKARKLPSEDIHYVHVDAEGDFWMATNGDGLYRWLRKTNSFQHKTIADGLSSNTLYGILQDEQGYLWMSSDHGLMRMNPRDFSVKTYTVKDGLTDNEFNRLSYHRADDGRMMFGTIDGINAFYPSAFYEDGTKRFDAPLQITSFLQFLASSGRLEDLTAALAINNEIVLHPGDNFFTLEFALLDYDEGKHKYAYMVEGMDDSWHYLDVNTLSLSRLPYGNYTLRIKGQNSAGEWSTREIKLPLLVQMPFYRQAWFVVACILLALLGMAIFVRIRIWQYRNRNEQLEEVVALRTVELKASLVQKEVLLKEIHHRVKNNLQVISSLLHLQSRSLGDSEARAALQESQNRVLSIALVHQKLYQNEGLDAIEFSSFANELFIQIDAVFAKQEKRVNFINLLPITSVVVDTAVPLGLVLNELITNSFKYAFHDTANPQIVLSLQKTDAGYEFEYKDNGPGLPPNIDIAKAKSLGLRLITRLTKQLNGTVRYQYDDGGVFTIVVPSYMMKHQAEVNN